MNTQNQLLDPAARHRERIFGWMSYENLAQTMLMFVALTLFFINLKGSVDAIGTSNTTNAVEIRALRSDVNLHTNTLQRQEDLVNEQAAKIEFLTKGREDDRKLLIELNTNVGVLLDRTGPHK